MASSTAHAPKLPPIASLPTAPIKTIIGALDTLFEPSTELHTLALPAIQSALPSALLSSYEALIRHIGALLYQLCDSTTPEARKKLHGILGSHPRLGAKKVDSAQSQAEQAQLNTGDAEEAEKLNYLNEEYEVKFPGLRYVVFVNGRDRAIIMDDMHRRIDRGDAKEEEREAITAMVDIALDRTKKLEAAG
ncbi:Oxo-4-hydroxy-4-carboxy-5-ureidoimidazoline decarboxylase [Pseudomassariella vexata]|uniref:Oxo-4-hydroxy-4-carboxy-5-ureidoimidazoline decarboxylase n=1 Tax=Pseudomassariella vexata TaxID=1141098 RepID=A0A1Y2DVI9_9PEZI|nr:Oxo-4-hydroxy-4-carboxy-5-ureidoimidazoline decarboxylase [Pseudomassariella vexata]ORY63267.1 Oxo-4-hydroxy-4-carboxy-5-ureidoimidazoline decarboxylase [Pseudomassariella vexata]